MRRAFIDLPYRFRSQTHNLLKFTRVDMASSTQSSPFALSSVGTKMIVAVTGLGLLLFVIAHMLGNLQIYAGPEAINNYAYKLKSMPAILWGARLGLLAIFLLHVLLTVKLWRDNHIARGDNRSGLVLNVRMRYLITE